MFGDPPGDFANALQCDGKHWCGIRCQYPAMEMGIAGELRTGPNTAEGIEHPVEGSLRSDLFQIAFLPRDPDDQELQVATAVIYE